MKKNLKVILTSVITIALCAAMAGCGSKDNNPKTPVTRNEADAQSTDSDLEDSTSVKSADNSVGLSDVTVDTRYVPSGARVSDDLPLEKLIFGDEDTGAEIFTIDITDYTLADLCETSEEKANGNYAIEVSGEGMVERDKPEFYLCTQSFSWDGGSFDVETMINGEIVTDRSSYEPSGSAHANADTSYADMKIKSISISRTTTEKEAMSFCNGAIGFNTPRSDVEAALGEGKEFILDKGEKFEKTLYVYQNEKATIAFKYGNGKKTAKENCVEEIYLFANN